MPKKYCTSCFVLLLLKCLRFFVCPRPLHQNNFSNYVGFFFFFFSVVVVLCMFVSIVPTKKQETIEEEETAPVLRDNTTIVDYVISLSVSSEVAATRYKSLPESSVMVGHNDEEGFKRRWARYQIIHDVNNDTPLSALSAVTELYHIETLDVPEHVAADDNAAIRTVTNYINTSNKYNYHPTEQEKATAKAIIDAKIQQQQAAEAKDQEIKAAEEKQSREEKQKMDEVRRAKVLLEDAELIESCSLPLRKYLMQNVIPALVDGLLDVCKVQPADPIDYLAEYLFKYSAGAPLEGDTSVQDRKESAKYDS